MKTEKLLEENVVEEFDFHEYGLSLQRSKTYKVSRSFMLPTCDGPPTSIPAGCKVRLGVRYARVLFEGAKIEPVVIPTEFEVVHDFTSVDLKGQWVSTSRGDIIRLEKQEALKLWRSGQIRPTKKEEWI